MGLDFTALDNITPYRAQEDRTAPLESETGNLAIKLIKPATGQNTAPQTHSHQLDKEKQERARLREAYSAYQQNIKRAGSLRGDLLKGIRLGEDPVALLLKAVECISLMTGDTAIYTQSQKDILAIYGYGLGEVAPLHIELQEAKARLERLQRAEAPPESAQRIQRAIKAHGELVKTLERKIESHEAGQG